MTPRCVAFLLVTLLPTAALGATSHDLRSRIRVDGDTGDFSPDEWILDSSTAFVESPRDSRWGTDNDIRGIALTWDDFNLYVAVPAVTVSSTLMLFLDTDCGGVNHLGAAGVFRRNIEFAGTSPNLLVKVRRASPDSDAGAQDCSNPLTVIDPGRYRAVYARGGVDGGALEVAVPWELLMQGFARGPGGGVLPDRGRVVRVLAAVTGGSGTGAGDAAPDPSVVLENDSTRLAILNNYVELPLDGDGDGALDTGVSPRSIATFGVSQNEGLPGVLPLQVVVQDRLIAPGNGATLYFRVSLNPADYGQPVYLSASIYSSDGHLITRLLEDEPRDLSGGGPVVWDSWDGRDNSGSVVPGGIYVLAVSGGPGRGAAKKTVKASFAVIR